MSTRGVGKLLHGKQVQSRNVSIQAILIMHTMFFNLDSLKQITLTTFCDWVSLASQTKYPAALSLSLTLLGFGKSHGAAIGPDQTINQIYAVPSSSSNQSSISDALLNNASLICSKCKSPPHARTSLSSFTDLLTQDRVELTALDS